MQHTRQIIRQVLNQLSSSHEAQYYLEQFSSTGDMRFAVIKVGGGIIEDQLDDLCSALSVLQHLGLHPILVHGAGPQLDKAINAAGIATKKVDGYRVTSEEVMTVARPTIYKVNRQIVNALEKQQVRAVGLLHSVFNCDYDDKEKYGLVGKVKGINLDSIQHAIESGFLPVIASLGETDAGQVVNINADVAARELILAISPSKIIFITPTGGLLDEDGELISSISLNNDYEKLINSDWVHSGMQLKLEQIHALLQPLPNTASVSITSVENLVRELFTHRGAGTLINKGEAINSHQTLKEDEKLNLTNLIESAFGRKLNKDYFDNNAIHKILISESGGAAAIVVKGFNGVPYLDKFAVTPEARGKGYAAALWRALKQECPQLYWRSRINNPFTPWYYTKADFSMKNHNWVSFSYGVEEFDYLKDCVNDAFAQHFLGRFVGNRFMKTNMKPPIKHTIAIIGARGYVGHELIKLTSTHPNCELVAVSSRSASGKKVADQVSECTNKQLEFSDLKAEDMAKINADVVFLALPNMVSDTYIKVIEKFRPETIIIDLSFDHRLDEGSEWAYGLSEIFASNIKKSKRISNPGCYATAAQLALHPLKKFIVGKPSVFGVSGYSGAGSTPNDKNNPENLKDNLLPYALSGHLHESEISKHSGHQVNFMPHVAAYFSGLSVTVSCDLREEMTNAQVLNIFTEAYKNDPLIKVQKDIPYPREIANKNGVIIGGFTIDERNNKNVRLVCVEDNLLKGAAVQAVQNMNLALGFESLLGIDF